MSNQIYANKEKLYPIVQTGRYIQDTSGSIAAFEGPKNVNDILAVDYVGSGTLEDPDIVKYQSYDSYNDNHYDESPGFSVTASPVPVSKLASNFNMKGGEYIMSIQCQAVGSLGSTIGRITFLIDGVAAAISDSLATTFLLDNYSRAINLPAGPHSFEITFNVQSGGGTVTTFGAYIYLTRIGF